MAEPTRVAVVGVSTTTVCGVRDHARLQAQALGELGVQCSFHWLQRSERSFAGSRGEIRAWTQALRAELSARELDAVLLHYSVFSYSHRGFPVFVRPVISALRSCGLPLLTVLHEFVYPWRRGGVRGSAWAVTQRALLIEVMRASAAVAVTMSWRIDWLATRPWLPRRRAVLAPVFSNLPRAGAGVTVDDAPAASIGMFGYAYEPHIIRLVVGAVREAQRAGQPLELLLIGAPGRDSPLGREWLEAARAAGVPREPRFSGLLPTQELSDRLASCTLLLSAEPSGPTSRKTTLAASLASGRPVLALDGRRSWQALLDARAAMVVAPSVGALAEAIVGLLEDAEGRDGLGARGQAFAARALSAQSNAQTIADVLAELVA